MTDNEFEQDAAREGLATQGDSTIAPSGMRLTLGRELQAWSNGGHLISLKARRAAALLCLIALSDSFSITRQFASVTLWSRLDRATGMVRLRKTLHHLLKTLKEAGVSCLHTEGNVISFRPELVSIDLSDEEPDSRLMISAETRFLVDLEGIDTALDHWLDRMRAQRQRMSRQDRQNDTSQPARATFDRTNRGPLLAILPFHAAGPPLKGRLASAVSEEIGACLARLRWLTVITTGADGRRLTTNSDLSGLADYAFVGTLQRDLTHYKLLVKVIDLQAGGAIVWAASFEQLDQDSFSLQRKFASLVVASVDSGLLLAETRRAQDRQSSAKGSAYFLVLRAIPAIYRLEREAFIAAGHALEEAVDLHRDFSMAHCWLAFWHIFLVGQGWTSNPLLSLQRAGEVAKRAVMLDPKDARAVSVAGHVKAFLHHQLEEADVLHEHAQQLNPALPIAWFHRGVTHLYGGHLEEALQCFETGQQLAPDDPHAFLALNGSAVVHLLRHRHQDAASAGRRVVELNPNFTSGYKTYLSALGHLGHSTQARAVLDRFRLLEPDFSLRVFNARAPYKRAQDLAHFAEGLRYAGVT